MALHFMYITNDVEIARICQKCGIDRIWIDMEYKGKNERQKGMDSVKSHHTIDDITKIKPILDASELLVRVNPIDAESEKEINDAIGAGADIIMLPMAKTLEEIKTFNDIIEGRCKKVLLLETKEAVENIDAFLETGIFDEIHIGLNDLSLSYNLKFMFQLLSNGIVGNLCNKIAQYEIPYGFGGIAQLGKGILPAEMIIPEHIRLGSTRVILSRSFYNVNNMTSYGEAEKIITDELAKIKKYEQTISLWNDIDFCRNKKHLIQRVNAVL
ncbi:MAG: aldolase [Lachnospiraceae bacterium]|nr:aldolase [Lachnospiraceae bacterium]